jgi:hypothetical protein
MICLPHVVYQEIHNQNTKTSIWKLKERNKLLKTSIFTSSFIIKNTPR